MTWDTSQFRHLVLDQTYTRALLGAALDSGYVSIKPPSGKEEHFTEKKLGLYLDRRSSKRYRCSVLEMAVLFERVHLFGVPYGFEFCRLTDEGLVGMAVGLGDWFEYKEADNPPLVFVQQVKPQLIQYIHRSINTANRFLNVPEVPRRIVSRAYDSLIIARQANIGLISLRRILKRILNDSHFLLSPDLKHQDVIFQMFAPLLREGFGSDLTSVVIGACLNQLRLYWASLFHATAFSTPLLSRFMSENTLARTEFTDDVSKSFRLCRLAMHEIIKYVPVVESIDDVLRLREKKSIKRFRELIANWCQALKFGEEHTLIAITKDVEKANREFRKLASWRKVDTWLFSAQLPALMVPLLSSLVTVASFSIGLWIRRTEGRYSWITIGR